MAIPRLPVAPGMHSMFHAHLGGPGSSTGTCLSGHSSGVLIPEFQVERFSLTLEKIISFWSA